MAIQRQLRVVGSPEVGDGLANSLAIAFATSDMKHVNQHFGTARSFAIYALNLGYSQLLEVVEFKPLAQDGNEDKLAAKVALLEGCAAVYCQAIGASAIRQLLSVGLQPMRVEENVLIADLLSELKQEMQQSPSAWILQAIKRQQAPDAGRFDAMEDEGWQE